MKSVIFLLLLIVGCGGTGEVTNNIVKNVKLGTTQIGESDVGIELRAEFDLGRFFFGSVTLPIFNPKEPEIDYGTVTFRPTLENTNEISVVINLSQMAQIKGVTARLPNGTRLPVGGIDEDDIIAIEIDKIDSRVYLSLSQTTAMFGFAIVIEEFDKLGDKMGTVNIFPGFIHEKVKGLAGLFTGPGDDENGLAFFVDLSGALKKESLSELIGAEFHGNDASYKTYESNRYKTRGVLMELYRMMNAPKTLNFKEK